MVWRRLAYFGETIAHSALLGVVLSLVLQIDLVLGIFVSACLITLLMFHLQGHGSLPADTVLGLLAHGGLATGLVIMAFFPNIRIDLQALLFGDILAVSRTDLALIWDGGALVLAALARIWRPLLAATVNEDLATVAGLRPERTRLIFGLLMATVIAVAIKIVGILLIVALLVIPPASARRFAVNPEQMAALAGAAGVLSIAGGLFASARLDTPSGPSIVVAVVRPAAVRRHPLLPLLSTHPLLTARSFFTRYSPCARSSTTAPPSCCRPTGYAGGRAPSVEHRAPIIDNEIS